MAALPLARQHAGERGAPDADSTSDRLSAPRTAWTEMTNNRSFAVRRRCLEIAVISILDNQRTHSRSPLCWCMDQALCLREDHGLCACGDGAPPQLRVVAADRAQRGRAHAGRVASRRGAAGSSAPACRSRRKRFRWRAPRSPAIPPQTSHRISQHSSQHKGARCTPQAQARSRLRYSLAPRQDPGEPRRTRGCCLL